MSRLADNSPFEASTSHHPTARHSRRTPNAPQRMTLSTRRWRKPASLPGRSRGRASGLRRHGVLEFWDAPQGRKILARGAVESAMSGAQPSLPNGHAREDFPESFSFGRAGLHMHGLHPPQSRRALDCSEYWRPRMAAPTPESTCNFLQDAFLSLAPSHSMAALKETGTTATHGNS